MGMGFVVLSYILSSRYGQKIVPLQYTAYHFAFGLLPELCSFDIEYRRRFVEF